MIAQANQESQVNLLFQEIAQKIEWRNKQELFCAKCLQYFDADFDQCPHCALEITQEWPTIEPCWPKDGDMMPEEAEMKQGELRVSVLEAAVEMLTVQVARLVSKPCPHCGKYVKESEVGNE